MDLAVSQARPAAPTSIYSIGEPTDEEQTYLELVNFARANPVAESQRLRDATLPEIRFAYEFFGVDIEKMVADIAALPPAPPLAMNSKLLSIARDHSQWMHDNAEQSHFGEGGKDVSDRANEIGYPWSTIAENVYAYSKGAEHGHAGFEVDWGFNPPTGLQDPPGHRLNNHELQFREVGIGIVNGMNTIRTATATNTVGPQLVTMNFGSSFNPQPLVTGVVYFDLNGDGKYDAGEGAGGILAEIEASQTAGISAGSGGYAVPATPGPVQVHFRAVGLNTVRTGTIRSNENIKIDLALPYQEPGVSGPTQVPEGSTGSFSVVTSPGLTAIRWNLIRRTGVPPVDGAELPTGEFTSTTATDFGWRTSEARVGGSWSFHLLHLQPPDNRNPIDQILERQGILYGRSNPSIAFSSRLGVASPTEVAKVQVTLDGFRWETVWQQAGVDLPGESVFTRKVIPLPAAAGREFRLRFIFEHTDDTAYYPQDRIDVGWLIDDIALADVEGTIPVGEGTVEAGQVIPIVPPSQGGFLLGARGISGSRLLPPGRLFAFEGTRGTSVSLRLANLTTEPGGGLRVRFNILSGSAAVYTLEKASDPRGPWTQQVGLSPVSDGGNAWSFRNVSRSGEKSFFRVRAQN